MRAAHPLPMKSTTRMGRYRRSIRSRIVPPSSRLSERAVIDRACRRQDQILSLEDGVRGVRTACGTRSAEDSVNPTSDIECELLRGVFQNLHRQYLQCL